MQVSGGILRDLEGSEIPPEVPPTSFPLRRHTPDHADHRLRALGGSGAARSGRDRDRCGDASGTQGAAQYLRPFERLGARSLGVAGDGDRVASTSALKGLSGGAHCGGGAHPEGGARADKARQPAGAVACADRRVRVERDGARTSAAARAAVPADEGVARKDATAERHRPPLSGYSCATHIRWCTRESVVRRDRTEAWRGDEKIVAGRTAATAADCWGAGIVPDTRRAHLHITITRLTS